MVLRGLAVTHVKQGKTRISERDRRFLEETLYWFGAFLVCTLFALVSAMPWAFTYLFIGRIIGPSLVLQYTTLLLLNGAISFVSVLVSMKLIKNRKLKTLGLSCLVSFLITLSLTASFSIVIMPVVIQADKKIDTFTVENKSLSFSDYAANVTGFLNENVGAAWDKPEATLSINRLVCYDFLDPHIMRIWGLTEPDLIVYQGWGSCGEAAILIEELLHGAEYETRLAHFKGLDHEWAEAQYNGTWVIVDPWYIGNLVDAKDLRNANSDFQRATGVEVRYRNGTMLDASQEHGY